MGEEDVTEANVSKNVPFWIEISSKVRVLDSGVH